MFFRTFRQDCEAHIALKVDDEGKALQVLWLLLLLLCAAIVLSCSS